MSKIKMFALGGLNEVGKNMYVVEVDDEIYVFDSGLKYADDNMLGIDYIIPNYDYLIDNEKRIKGIFLTHGHDEQIGALPDILVDLPNVKIYGTKFTLDLLKEELDTENMKADLHEIKPHQKITVGKNDIFPISVSHNVPDSVGYVLYTKDGAIFYTGSFVFDPTMHGNYKTDIGKLAYVGKQGVLCLLSESKYADKIGYTSPNHRSYSYLREIVNNNDKRILFNIYQGQIFRIQELFNTIIDTDRKVVIMGKRLENSILKAIDNGYLNFAKNKIGNIRSLDNNSIVIISDEREKPFSNLKRIIKGYDKFITLKEDDTIVFASPVYDGMEKTATNLFDAIAKKGCNLIIMSSKKFPSLHASSEDLMLMLDLMKPKYYFPIMGEYRHQVANGEIAKQLGYKDDNIILKLNGQVASFTDGILEDGGMVKVDDILVDGKTAGDIGELVLKDREMLGENGIVLVVATINKKTKEILYGPEIVTKGFVYVKENIDLINEATKMTENIIKKNTKPLYIDYNKVKMEIRDEIGKYFYSQTENKPVILIIMQEV